MRAVTRMPAIAERSPARTNAETRARPVGIPDSVAATRFAPVARIRRPATVYSSRTQRRTDAASA
jgi:hypothetical protein